MVVKKKAAGKVKAKAKPKVKKEKLLGKVMHYFDKISVAAIQVSAPFKVGDVIHIKGHTTDFEQPVDSIQIEHESVQKVKKGDDIGIKVKELVREHDGVYLKK
jgi:putative protease